MLVVHAAFPVDSDRRDEAVGLFGELAERSRGGRSGGLPGRVRRRRPNVFRFSERCEDEAPFGAHAETDHFEELEATLPDLLAGEPEVTRFDADAAMDVDV